MTLPAPGRRGGLLASVNVPIISRNVARRGNNPFMRTLATLIMRVTGWRFSGELFPDAPKMVMIVVPHTSNWDFAVGLTAMYSLGIQGTFLAKASLFRFPMGVILRWLGGFPVDRSARSDVVTQAVDLIKRSERIIPVITPEGTRSRMNRWRSGFYWIAHRAGVPILPVAFDYAKKHVHFYPLFTTTGDHDADVAELKAKFRPEMAKFPAQYTA
ncbi:MAG TPA: lysophospholipid acyltransferase family protein [Gemmatimonadaceae bacterium]|nr:lysophospholipid acyltransferase family protein [Gemmatimonadaceae bacterium]